MKIIDPILDAGFKLIFGRENVSEPLLINLLNSIFCGDPVLGNIVSLKFTNTEHPHEQIEGRGLRYDVHCETSTGHHFIVEMQKGEQKHLIERSQYYVARAIAAQGYKGRDDRNMSWDFSLTPVVSVFFCNFEIAGLESEPVVYAGLCDMKSGKLVDASQRYVYIQLPCFLKQEADCENKLDEWIYNIKNMGATQTVAFKDNDAIFSYLNSVSSVAALSHNEREVYEAALMYSRDYHAILATATEKGMEKGMEQGLKQGLEKGLKQGLEKGMKQGLQQGLEQGMKEGLQQGLEKGLKKGELEMLRKNVLSMRSKGLSDESIADILDQPLSVISNIS